MLRFLSVPRCLRASTQYMLLSCPAKFSLGKEGTCTLTVAMKAQTECLTASLRDIASSQALAHSSSLSVKGGQEGFGEVGACVQARSKWG
jgi:hypothetical protein